MIFWRKDQRNSSNPTAEGGIATSKSVISPFRSHYHGTGTMSDALLSGRKWLLNDQHLKFIDEEIKK